MGIVVSASRRTDIPAFYADWFYKRWEEGFAYSVNPFNPKQRKKVTLDAEELDGIVFWTRDAGPIIDRLDRLDPVAYYFNITLTPYGEDVEKVFSDKAGTMESIKGIHDKAGPGRVVWRYDPVFFNGRYDMGFHKKSFSLFAGALEGLVETCIISFVDEYAFAAKRMKKAGIGPVDVETMCSAASFFREEALSHGITVKSCAEKTLGELMEIEAASCIDIDLLSRISGKKIKYEKDPNQRDACGCATSVDIGTYDTCPGGCAYCYASRSAKTLRRNLGNYDVDGPALCRGT